MTGLLRATKESRIEIHKAENYAVATGLPFFDHMLSTFLRYARLSWSVRAQGDLKHHLMEDVAITMGQWFRQTRPDTCARYGECTLPMDEALVQAAVDIGGRGYFVGATPSRLYTHWFRSFAINAEITLHLRKLRGTDRHHLIEAAFKATGLAMRHALKSEGTEVFSTKGQVTWESLP